MACIGVSIHTPISAINASLAVGGALELQFAVEGDGYSHVTIFTGDQKLADCIKAAFDGYMKEKASAMITDGILERTRDELANGDGDDHEDADDDAYSMEDGA